MRLVSVILIALIASPAVYSQETGSDVPLMDVRVVSIDDDKWLAFTMEDAKALLKMRLDYPKMELVLERFSDSLRIKEKIILNQEGIIANQGEQIFVLEGDNTKLRKELNSERKWYKDPWFWFAMGLVLGGGTVAAVTWSVK